MPWGCESHACGVRVTVGGHVVVQHRWAVVQGVWGMRVDVTDKGVVVAVTVGGRERGGCELHAVTVIVRSRRGAVVR
jgi:hypothetical protein